MTDATTKTPLELVDDQLATMSDDELMALVEPPSAPISEEPAQSAEAVEEAPVEEELEESAAVEEEAPEDDTPLGSADEDLGDDPPVTAPAAKAEEPKAEEPAQANKEEPKTETVTVDYKAAYDKIMAPFKANGKQVQLQSPEEVIQLMQMGANYTQKLQALKPNLKLVRMLENNGLLDENRLSFLIDLDKRDPAAIAKFLKDGNIDPMDIDTQSAPEYQPGNHKVSDQDMTFVDVIRDVRASPEGAALIQKIDREWDAQSKKALWEDPQILTVINEHRENGIFDRVSAEIDRRRMFGEFQNVPFIQAYYAAAKSLQEQGALVTTQATPAPTTAPGGTPAAAPATQPRVVAQRPAVSKPAPGGDKIRAAQPARAAARAVKPDFNPLSMSDEDFEKSAQLAMRI